MPENVAVESVTGQVSHALKGEGCDASEDGIGRGNPIVAQCLTARTGQRYDPETETLPVMAFNCKQDGSDASSVSPTLRAMSHKDSHANGGGQIAALSNITVRRLTPRECERLQGFPDDYTLIPGAKDTPRYKALGNSMAVPVMRWIFERIAQSSS